jgi:transcriptional regulator with XRE-family HTH domain
MSRSVFDSETLTKIGQRIREVRGNATQQDFAARIGVGRTVLANYEAGRRMPDNKTMEKIASQSGAAVLYLLYGEATLPDLFAVDAIKIDSRNSFAVACALALSNRLKKPNKGYSKRNNFMNWAEVFPLMVRHFEVVVRSHSEAAGISLEEAANVTITNMLAADESELQGLADSFYITLKHLGPQ